MLEHVCHARDAVLMMESALFGALVQDRDAPALAVSSDPLQKNKTPRFEWPAMVCCFRLHSYGGHWKAVSGRRMSACLAKAWTWPKVRRSQMSEAS